MCLLAQEDKLIYSDGEKLAGGSLADDEALWEIGAAPLVQGLSVAEEQNLILVGDHGGKITSSSLTSGEQVWEQMAAGKVRCLEVVASQDLVLSGSEGNSIQAWSLGTGNLKWEADVGGPVHALFPLVARSLVFVGDAKGSGSRHVQALHMESGMHVWTSHALGSEVSALFASDERGLVVGLLFVQMMGWSVVDGAQLWAVDVPGCSRGGSFCAVDGWNLVVVGCALSGAPKAKAWSLDAGTEQWELSTREPPSASCAVHAQKVFVVGQSGGQVIASAADVGTLLWSTDVVGYVQVMLVVEPRNVVVVASLGCLSLLHLADGACLFSRAFHSPGGVIRVLATKGNVLSCSNHVRVLSLDALLDHGVVIETSGCKHSAVAWMDYAIESALLAVSFLQILSFASSVPAPPGPEKAIAQQLQVFQHLGIDVATFEVWLPNPFMVALSIAGSIMILFSTGVLCKDRLETGAFLAPSATQASVYQALCVFVKLTASAGFIPLISMMLKVFVCSTEEGQPSVLREDPHLKCWSGSHVVLCALAVLVLVPYVGLASRLGLLDYELSLVEFRCMRPWDRADDAQARNRLRKHPLSMLSSAYDRRCVLVKCAVVLIKLFLVGAWRDVPASVALFSVCCVLLHAGWTLDRYHGGQRAEGRWFEPNALGTALDAFNCWTFFCSLAAALAVCLEIKARLVLACMSALSVAFPPLAYFARLRFRAAHGRSHGSHRYELLHP